MPLRHLPIQRKLVWFIFLTTLTVLLGSNVALFIYESRSFQQATAQNLTTMGDIIAANSTAALIYDDPKLAQEIISGIKAEPDITAAALYDKQGRLYATYPAKAPKTAFPSSPGEIGGRFSLRDFVLFRPVVQGDNVVGTLFIRSDLNAMYRRLGVYSLVLFGVLFGSAVLAYVLSNFLQKQISQPILELAETARLVSEQKDFSVRAHSEGSDELGFVTDAFNSMLDQIQLNNAALGESEQRFRLVADSAPALIWVVGVDRKATWFNKDWLNFVNRSMEQELGDGWIENLYPPDRGSYLGIFTEAFDARRYFRMECRLLRYDGKYRWLLNQGTPRYQGEEFAGFIGSCVDITDNKEAEEAVRLSELQMRLVTDNASVFLCEITPGHHFKFVNPAYARRYGLEVNAIIGRHLSEVIGTAGYEKVREKLDLAFAGARQEFEIEIPYSTLGRRWIHAIYEPARSEDGKVSAVITVLTDITDRRLAAMELEHARDEAVNASRAKDDFLAALSHELRTPLNPILLLATDAVNNPSLPPDVRRDFEIVRKNVELEARLIDDLLDLTRITKGKMVVEQRPVEIHGVMRDALATIDHELKERKIELVLDWVPGRVTVIGDQVRLQQAFWNIFKNAVKFTPERGGITIGTAISNDRRKFTISVTDTGIGLTPPELRTVFEAFNQGDHARGVGLHRFGGLGLGLAISRKMIELHSGTITAKSEGRNMGSTFEVELPVEMYTEEKPVDGFPSRTSQSDTMGRIEPGTVSRSILLVEDHPATRSALERLLKRRGFKVLSSGTVAEARAIAETSKLDFVISDIGLPDGNGFDLMAELEQRYHLKGIALTGFGTESDIAKSRKMGFIIHLTKPVGMPALDSAIAAITRELQPS
jgi:PAS domain S-box-containing protein